ncbi:MAG: acyltransferase [Rhodobacteraceae bacterium]|nr:acyltransferase [Paracoccaceae bacterium]
MANKIEIDPRIRDKVHIRVKGDNNVVRVGGNRIDRIDIIIDGDGCRFEAPQIRRLGKLRVNLSKSGKISIGDHTSIEEALMVSDRSIFIGKDCMVSYQCVLRTTDAHGIYDSVTGELMNGPGDVNIGDHVWLGAGVMVGKYSKIGRGSVIGARSLVQNVEIEQGVIAAGVPAKIIKRGIVWDRRMCENIYHENADTDWRLAEFLAA